MHNYAAGFLELECLDRLVLDAGISEAQVVNSQTRCSWLSTFYVALVSQFTTSIVMALEESMSSPRRVE